LAKRLEAYLLQYRQDGLELVLRGAAKAVYSFLKVPDEIVAFRESFRLLYVVDVVVLKLGVKEGSLKVVLFHQEAVPGVDSHK
jgi:hypothetical protein